MSKSPNSGILCRHKETKQVYLLKHFQPLRATEGVTVFHIMDTITKQYEGNDYETYDFKISEKTGKPALKFIGSADTEFKKQLESIGMYD